MQPVREAIRSHGAALKEVRLEGSPGQSPRLDAIARFAMDQGVHSVSWRSREELDRLSQGVTHQGAIAVAPALKLIDPLALACDPALFAVALDRIQDPQNFGAVVRSAVALADAAIVWPENASAPLSAATFRASAGAIEHARLCRVPSLHGWLREAASHGVMVVGLDANAPDQLEALTLSRPLVLVVGSEHRGLNRPVRDACTGVARLLQRGPIASVNASVAAAVALYTARISLEKSAH